MSSSTTIAAIVQASRLLVQQQVRRLATAHTNTTTAASRLQDKKATTNEFELNSNSSELEKNNDNDNDDNDDDEFGEFDAAASVPDFEEALERDKTFHEEVERLRDVSRFSKVAAERKHRQQYFVVTPDNEMSDVHPRFKDPKFKRKLYAKLGSQSEIEPGMAWPSKSELQELIEDEKEYDLTLKQKVDILIERKTAAQNNLEKMEQETNEQLNRMPKQIDSFYQRIIRKDKLEEERDAKKREVLDQAREFYGYDVDLRDGRVQEMLKKIQEEKKKADKLRKKEEDLKKAQANSLAQKLKEAEKKKLKEEAATAETK